MMYSCFLSIAHEISLSRARTRVLIGSRRPAVLSWVFLLLFSGGLAITGCMPDIIQGSVISEPLPTPTTFTFFREGENEGVGVPQQISDVEGVPTVASLFTEKDTPTPKPSPTPLPTTQPSQPTPAPQQITQTEVLTTTVFSDSLDRNWEIQKNDSAEVDLASSIRVYSGQSSLAFTPQEDFSTLYFTVRRDAEVAYPSQQVLGISFWINGGGDHIQLDELGLAVIGSNEYSYWVADDDSVELPEGETFSETRLYWLDLNRPIPPETWVQVFLPLETLIFDPEYENVVGFYLKNDEGFRNTIYLDEISVIMLKGSETLVQPSSTSTPTPTPTPELTTAAQIAPEITASPTVTPMPEDVACVVTPPNGWEVYIVQAGDTYSGLALQSNIALDYMLRVNCLDIEKPLSIGLDVWLPPQPPPTKAPPRH